LQAIVPLTFKQSKQLISADTKSNTYNYKFTYSVEIPPICRDDLVCLPVKLANHMGNISPLVLCYKVSNIISFVDPFTGQVSEITEPSRYWNFAFRALASRDRLIEFLILDISVIPSPKKSKFYLAEATVARMDTMGTSDKTYFTVTHLGNILNVGDTILGYDLENSNFNDSDVAPLKGRQVRSEIILVKKTYPTRRKRIRNRHWKLAKLTVQPEIDEKKGRMVVDDRGYEEFLRDLEEDPEMRSQINLYKVPNPQTKPSDTMVEEEEDFPDVEVNELLEMVEDLTLGEDDSNDQ